MCFRSKRIQWKEDLLGGKWKASLGSTSMTTSVTDVIWCVHLPKKKSHCRRQIVAPQQGNERQSMPSVTHDHLVHSLRKLKHCNKLMFRKCHCFWFIGKVILNKNIRFYRTNLHKWEDIYCYSLPWLWWKKICLILEEKWAETQSYFTNVYYLS